MKQIALIGVVVACIGAITAWVLSAPVVLTKKQIAQFPSGDAKNGEMVFWAGGCASCHAADKAKGVAKLLLTGGHELKTPFGIFRAPNISTDKRVGIGAWSLGNFANAMKNGVRPDGSHYFPAFPYTSYTRMTDKDVADLWAFMKKLPESANKVADHSIPFPFNIRRGLGLWKWLYLDKTSVLQVANENSELLRGRYLVEALGHCGECHTPRNIIGGMDKTRWLAGGVGPEGKEKIPNITPHKDGVGDWSKVDLAYGLETGFTPEFDSFGSSMVAVQENMAKLSALDRNAIALYLKSIGSIAGKP